MKTNFHFDHFPTSPTPPLPYHPLVLIQKNKKPKRSPTEESGFFVLFCFFTSGSRSFSRQALTSLYSLEEEIGARKEVYSPGMLTPSSTVQEGYISSEEMEMVYLYKLKAQTHTFKQTQAAQCCHIPRPTCSQLLSQGIPLPG